MYAHLIKPRGHFSACEHVPAAAAGAEPLQIPRNAALISVHSKAAAMAALIDSLVPPKERSAKARPLNSTAHLPPIHVTSRKARDYSELSVRSRYSSAPAHSAAHPDAMPHGGYIAAATLLARMHRRAVDADPVAVDSRTELCDELWKRALIEKESSGLLTMKQMDALLAHFNAVRDGTAVLKNLSMHAFSHLPWRPSDVVTDYARERAFLTLSTDGLFDVRAFVRMVTMQTVGPRAQRRKYLFDCLDAANRRVVDLPALHHFLVSHERPALPSPKSKGYFRVDLYSQYSPHSGICAHVLHFCAQHILHLCSRVAARRWILLLHSYSSFFLSFCCASRTPCVSCSRCTAARRTYSRSARRCSPCLRGTAAAARCSTNSTRPCSGALCLTSARLLRLGQSVAFWPARASTVLTEYTRADTVLGAPSLSVPSGGRSPSGSAGCAH
jgi:hypothetical protein